MTQTNGRLHVEANLRVIEHHENARKHNSWDSPGRQRPGDEAALVAADLDAALPGTRIGLPPARNRCCALAYNTDV